MVRNRFTGKFPTIIGPVAVNAKIKKYVVSLTWESLFLLEPKYGYHVTIVTKNESLPFRRRLSRPTTHAVDMNLFMHSKPIPFAGMVQQKGR